MRRKVIVPGNMDGVHRGHQALIEKAQEIALERGNTEAIAMFFYPHPAEVLRGQGPSLLSTAESRKARIEQYCMADQIDFDEDLAVLSPSDFVREYFVDRHSCCALVCGTDFRFGKGRAGNVQTLQALGSVFDFDVWPLEDFCLGRTKVSSSHIRESLRDGKIHEANRMLGRAYEISGLVVRGEGVARKWGYPTANLQGVQTLVPKDGVYCGRVTLSGKKRIAAVSIGERPTVEFGRAIECHILDYQGDLYGKVLSVEILGFLRDEEKFSSVEELKTQIERDVEKIRELGVEYGPNGLLR